MRKKVSGLKRFYKSHLWCQIFTILIIALLFAVFAGRWYLRNAFMDFVEKNIYSVENSALSSSNVMLESSLRELVQLGSTMAMNQELADVVNGYRQNPRGAYEEKCLYELLGEYVRRSQWVMLVTVSDEEGVLYQFDRNLRGGANNKYLCGGEETERYFGEMYDRVQQKVKNRQIPQYDMSAFPVSMKEIHMIHLTFPLKGSIQRRNVNENVPVVVLSVNTEIFHEFIENLYDYSGQLVQGYLTDDRDIVFLHRNTDYIGMPREEYLGSDGINLEEGIARTGLTANISIDGAVLEHQVSDIYNKGMLIYNLFFAAAFLVIMFTIKWALRPVDAIKHSIEKVKKGDFMELIQIKGEHEIWQLAREYNQMITAVWTMHEEMERQYQENVRAIQMKQEAEREALESQINAHFICNTLNAINYEVMEAGNYKVSTLIKKLSNILRYTFEQKKQNVYMMQEIAWIEQYLFLQKLRLMDTFEYEIDFPDEFMDWPCRKLMLQPFVENSILHGFEGWHEGGRLLIRGIGEDDKLKIVISDNGNGMDEERKKMLQSILEDPMRGRELKVGIGISNVTMRMKMYYGENFKIYLETEENHGTTFTFILPRTDRKGGDEE